MVAFNKSTFSLALCHIVYLFYVSRKKIAQGDVNLFILSKFFVYCELFAFSVIQVLLHPCRNLNACGHRQHPCLMSLAEDVALPQR